MRKKMYWVIASLILIFGVVSRYFILQPESNTEPEKRFIVPTEADLKKVRETRKPPPGANPNKHWHDESHAEPATVPQSQTVSTEEAASDDIVWTIESVKRSRENLLNSLPILIEANKKDIETYEKIIETEGYGLEFGDHVKKTLIGYDLSFLVSKHCLKDYHNRMDLNT